MLKSKVLEILNNRFSVRKYKDTPIEDEKLEAILEAGRLSPSASNYQPWNFYVIKDKEKRAALARKMPLGSHLIINSFIAEAPITIIATAGPIDFLRKAVYFLVNKRWHYLDVSIALENMSLVAWELGIGSCWIALFDEKKVKKLIDIPKNQEVIAMLTLGYPDEERSPFPKHRKNMEEIVRYR